MLFFLISCFSFFLLSQTFLNPNKASKIKPQFRKFPCFFTTIHHFFLTLTKKRRIFINFFQVPRLFPSALTVKMESSEDKQVISLLDLPDLPLDLILEKLSPSGLCSMSRVCNFLREKCKSDHFWEKHMEQKWSKFLGDAAYREWQHYISLKRVAKFLNCGTEKSSFRIFSGFLNFFLNKSKVNGRGYGLRSSLPANSTMAWYLALESGKFWFPAQVFNRENGHVGFMLSYYDAKLSYDSTTDNFVARFSAQGRRMIEADIEWNRIRAPTTDTPAEVLHISKCLDELKPDDHIEIQWRKNKEFPCGWWYGVVGHLEGCNSIEFNCQCHINDMVILEFKQYALESRWRKIVINRKDHSEVGNEADGFYGGIRKLYKEEEIAKWRQLWPKCIME